MNSRLTRPVLAEDHSQSYRVHLGQPMVHLTFRVDGKTVCSKDHFDVFQADILCRNTRQLWILSFHSLNVVITIIKNQNSVTCICSFLTSAIFSFDSYMYQLTVLVFDATDCKILIHTMQIELIG